MIFRSMNYFVEMLFSTYKSLSFCNYNYNFILFKSFFNISKFKRNVIAIDLSKWMTIVPYYIRRIRVVILAIDSYLIGEERRGFRLWLIPSTVRLTKPMIRWIVDYLTCIALKTLVNLGGQGLLQHI